MTKSRIFLGLLLACIVGVGLRSFAEVPIFIVWLGITAAVMVMVIGIFRRRKAVIVYGFFFLAILGGILRFDSVERQRPDLSSWYGQDLVLQGFIIEEPRVNRATQQLKMKVEAVDEKKITTPFYLLVTLRRYPEFQVGDELRVHGLFREPQNFSDFDYAEYLAKEDVFAAMNFPLVEKIGENKGGALRIFLSKMKQAFEEKIERSVPEPHSAFLEGLILGERESLPQDLVENFNRSGTTHIVALSGYNITLVGRFFIGLLLLVSMPFQAAFWMASVSIALFVMLTGASPSVVRAGIMGILVLIAQREGRMYRITNALAFAGAVMIFHNPKILRFDAAFQLSFLATLGLVYLAPYLEKTLERFRPWRPKKQNALIKSGPVFSFKQILVETTAAQLMVLPLLIYLFGRVSIISPIANLLVLIAVPYSMVFGFITGALGFLWQPFAGVVGWIAWGFLEYKIRIIEFFAGLPFASVEIGGWAVIPLLLLYGYVFWKTTAPPRTK